MKHEFCRQRIIMNLKEYLNHFAFNKQVAIDWGIARFVVFFIPDKHRRKALSKPQTKQINADDITFNFRDETKRTGDGKLKNPPRFPSATIRRFLFLPCFIPFYPRFFLLLLSFLFSLFFIRYLRIRIEHVHAKLRSVSHVSCPLPHVSCAIMIGTVAGWRKNTPGWGSVYLLNWKLAGSCADIVGEQIDFS